MTEEEAPVYFIPNAIPLFVDCGVEIACMGVFKWPNNKYYYYSYFPVIVHSPNFPNLYVSLTNFNSNDPLLSKIFNDLSTLKIQSITDFSPIRYNNEKLLLTYTNNENLSNEISSIVKNKLNPLGIGVFYSRRYNFARPLKSDETNSDSQVTYVHSPFSMEIVERLLYNPGKADIDLNEYDCISLMSLMYPLNPLMIPMNELNTNRGRLIFSRIILKSPPLFCENEFTKLLKSKDDSEIKKIQPNQWIMIEFDDGQTFSSDDKIYAAITVAQITQIRQGRFLNLLPYCQDCQDVIAQFNGKRAFIMSPYEGYLSVLTENGAVQYPWTARYQE